MHRLTIAIDPAVRTQFPDLVCGAFLARGLAGIDMGRLLLDPETMKARLAAAEIREETLLAHPLLAGWRRAIQACGLKASKFRGSAEQLVRRALRGDEIRAAGEVVRLYCQISALHAAPLGGYDIDALPSRDIMIRFARPTDRFQPLGGGEMSLDERIVVYAAGNDVICWAFNVRDDARTALRETMRDALFTTEAVDPAQRLASEAALQELREALSSAGATVTPLAWTTGAPVELE
ncbi:MAG TPA: phenylalanine--tRNA ligase beta subunit-related protein [Thermoanaerobaculia bacterium]|nr:phenylalanine--tRNA ligase beta subunit-related protein [Thermoanaerobaculia bacterium]